MSMRKKKVITKTRIISVILVLLLVFSGCFSHKKGEIENVSEVIVSEEIPSEQIIDVTSDIYLQGYHLDDSNDLEAYKTLVYEEIVDQIDSDNIVVEDVQVAYYSDEYLQDVMYNSKESVFFGYTLSELDEQFGGQKYAFSLAEDGSTEVHPFENYDFTTEEIIRDVAIGSGVIIVCVIVTVATYGAASEATVPCAVVVVNDIAGKMAVGAAVTAASSATIGGVSAAIITGLETKDMNAAIKAAAVQASKDYKWGAIAGAATAGISETINLAWASGSGLSIKEAAFIQKETKLSAKLIRQLKSFDQYKELVEMEKNGGLAVAQILNMSEKTKYPVEMVKLFRVTEEGSIYSEQAGLYVKEINGKLALVRDIDLTYESKLAGKTVTNLQRMQQGYAPLDPATGEAYQLHHIGQKVDSPLAILTEIEHKKNGNNTILHDSNIGDGNGVHSIISDSEWAAQRKEFWIAFAKAVN